MANDFLDKLSDDIDNVFLNSDEFALEGTYVDVDSNSFTLNGIFDDPYSETDPNVQAVIQSIQPTFKVKLQDVLDGTSNNGVRKGDKITIETVEYSVLMSKPDGQGLTELTLQKF